MHHLFHFFFLLGRGLYWFLLPTLTFLGFTAALLMLNHFPKLSTSDITKTLLSNPSHYLLLVPLKLLFTKSS